MRPEALVHDVFVAVLTFITGVFTRFVYDDRTVADSAELERLLHAIATAAYSTYADD